MPLERRRLEDRLPGVMLASLGQAGELAGGAGVGAGSVLAHEDQSSMLLVQDEEGQLLCISGATAYRVPRSDGVPLEEVVQRLAEHVQQQHAAALQKRRFADGFLVFVERVNRARTHEDVYRALLEQLPDLIGGYAAALLVVRPGDDRVLEPIADPRLPSDLGPIDAAALHPNPVPTLLHAYDTEPGQPFAGLAPVFTRAGARHITCMEMGEFGMLLLVERRSRDLSGEEWFRLQAVAHHSQAALERLQLRAHPPRFPDSLQVAN